MPDQPALSVVIAVRNEATIVATMVERLRQVLCDFGAAYEIVAVDDGSTDATVATLRRLETASGDLQVIELDGNQGQVTALACGLFHARGEIVATLDGDLQDPPEELPRVLAALDAKHAIASGSRGTRHEPLLRWLASRAVHHLTCWCTGVRLRDFGGNFRAYRRDVVEAMRRTWVPQTPLLPLAVKLGFAVNEVTVRRDRRTTGESRYGLGALLRIVQALLSTFPGALLRLSIVPASGLGLAAWVGVCAWSLPATLLAGVCAYEAVAARNRRRRATQPPYLIRHSSA